ncbi:MULTISPECIES: DDE-type integrase/transposase/recombinase [unclassified Halanaerobium]|uniref:DDE-type integrase/transposase/recombinase n=1 Tax=unclassified Halanaerobium TaxID=2641197 RepID=UPI001F29AADB|nr:MULTISPECIES: DDE-type integrase/transposase/recombinase [unclassified Halanaerobium]
MIDVFTREIVGYHKGLRCSTKEALKALDEAAESRNTDDLILRTDNGTRFRSR